MLGVVGQDTSIRRWSSEAGNDFHLPCGKMRGGTEELSLGTAKASPSQGSHILTSHQSGGGVVVWWVLCVGRNEEVAE